MQLILLSFEQQPRMCPCPQGEKGKETRRGKEEARRRRRRKRESGREGGRASVFLGASHKSHFLLLIRAASLKLIPVPLLTCNCVHEVVCVRVCVCVHAPVCTAA